MATAAAVADTSEPAIQYFVGASTNPSDLIAFAPSADKKPQTITVPEGNNPF